MWRKGVTVVTLFCELEWWVINNHIDDPDRETVEELNRKYGKGRSEERGAGQERLRPFMVALVLVVCITFLFSTLGRRLYLLTWPPWELLQESRELERDPLVKELQREVVSLEVRTRKGTGVAGTGFNLHSRGLIVTNRHLVEDASMVRVFFLEHGSYGAVEWREYPHADLAVIFLEEEGLPRGELAEGDAAPGDEVLVIGNPLRYYWLVKQGTVVGFRSINEHAPSIMLIDAPIGPGSSGSPVYSQEGKVLGVIYATPGEGEGGLAVGVSELKRFLSGLEEEGWR